MYLKIKFNRLIRRKVEETPILKDIVSMLEYKFSKELTKFHDPDQQKFPIGMDGKIDMRLYPGKRVATEEIKKKIAFLPPDETTFMMLPAVSGAGKTSTAFEIATAYYTLYFVCCPTFNEVNKRNSKTDPSTLPLLEEEADKFCQHSQHLDKRSKTQEVKRMATILLVCHFLGLYCFMDQLRAESTPFRFLMFQLSKSGMKLFVADVFAKLKNLTELAALQFASVIREAIKELVSRESQKFILVIDEMESAATTMTQYFASRTVTENGLAKDGRGLLTPLLQAAGDCSDFGGWNLLLMGTGSVLARSESVTSDIGKGAGIQFHSDYFPSSEKKTVDTMLKTLLGLNQEEIDSVPQVEKYLVNSRYRLLSLTIENFMKSEFSTDDTLKTIILIKAIEDSVTTHKTNLKESLDKYRVTQVTDQLKNKFLADLHSVYVSAKFCHGQVFPKTSEDWCKIGLAFVDNEQQFHVLEQFAFESIEEYFRSPTLSDFIEVIEFNRTLKGLRTLMEIRGTKDTGKENLFEELIFRYLILCKRKKVTELPFVRTKDRKACSFWKDIVFNLKEVGVRLEKEDDADFLSRIGEGFIFSPTTVHRADGVAILKKLESSYVLFELGCKLYSSSVPSKDALSQFRATDPKCAYQLAKSELPNLKAKIPLEKWKQAKLNTGPALRLHITLPCAQVPDSQDDESKLKLGTQVLEDRSLVINLDASNIHDLFFSKLLKGTERKELYRLLWMITKHETFRIKDKKN